MWYVLKSNSGKTIEFHNQLQFFLCYFRSVWKIESGRMNTRIPLFYAGLSLSVLSFSKNLSVFWKNPRHYCFHLYIYTSCTRSILGLTCTLSKLVLFFFHWQYNIFRKISDTMIKTVKKALFLTIYDELSTLREIDDKNNSPNSLKRVMQRSSNAVGYFERW